MLALVIQSMIVNVKKKTKEKQIVKNVPIILKKMHLNNVYLYHHFIDVKKMVKQSFVSVMTNVKLVMDQQIMNVKVVKKMGELVVI